MEITNIIPYQKYLESKFRKHKLSSLHSEMSFCVDTANCYNPSQYPSY